MVVFPCAAGFIKWVSLTCVGSVIPHIHITKHAKLWLQQKLNFYHHLKIKIFDFKAVVIHVKILLDVAVRIRLFCCLSLWVKWVLWYVDMSVHFHGLVAVLCLTLILNGIQQGAALLTDAWGLSHPSSLHLASTHNHVTHQSNCPLKLVMY